MTLAALAIATEVAAIAELAIPPRKPAADASNKNGPPNRAPWTDECVNGASGEPSA